MKWKAIANEPLVHFVLLGAILFGVDRLSTRDVARPAPKTPPTAPAPIERTLLVDADATERDIDQEILFREALARGLERDDPAIRERIASRMSYVLAESIVAPEPTEAELRAHFEAHRERYGVPERIDFTHVFVADRDEQRISELAAKLAAGAPPETLGDTFSGGRKYRGRKLADLAEAFGPELVDGLAAQAPGSWVRRASRHGLHLVRVDRVDPARAPDFETAKLEVRRELVEAYRARAGGEAFRKLREQWKIVRR